MKLIWLDLCPNESSWLFVVILFDSDLDCVWLLREFLLAFSFLSMTENKVPCILAPVSTSNLVTSGTGRSWWVPEWVILALEQIGADKDLTLDGAQNNKILYCLQKMQWAYCREQSYCVYPLVFGPYLQFPLIHSFLCLIFQRHRRQPSPFFSCFFLWGSWTVCWISSRECCWSWSKYASKAL